MENTDYSNIIGSKRFKLAQNTNTNLQLQLEEKTKPLTEYGIIKILNLEDVFNEERLACKKYRINGKINIYTGNELSPTATNKFWDPLFYGNPPSPPNWVMQILYPSENDYNMVVGDNEAYRGLDFKSLSTTVINGKNKLTIIGKQRHNLIVGDFVYLYSTNSFLSLQGIYQVLELGINGKNTEIDVTLDYNIDTPPTNSGSFIRVVNPSYDDINPKKFVNVISQAFATDISGLTTGTYAVDEIKYTTITTNLPHNLLKNNFVDIRIDVNNVLNGLWRVYNIVNATKFVIRLNSSNIKGTQVTLPNSQCKFKVMDGTPSEYYVRKFEVLTTNDYSTYPCAFSSTIYSDGVSNNTWLFQFNQDITVNNLKDNRGGEVSQFYFSIIKRSGSKPYPWGNVTSHWDFNYSAATATNGIQNISLSTINVGTVENLTARTETVINNEIQIINGSKYIGDFVEFNSYEIKEVTCADVINRFATVLDESEGYYYKPFKKLEIRKYSNVIEYAQISDNVIDVPGNYVTYPDGSIGWRDLLPIGFYQEGDNGVEYPFLNNSHYYYFNHNLFVRRQRPQNIVVEPTDLSIDPNNLNVVC